jgi:hypothetical protein
VRVRLWVPELQLPQLCDPDSNVPAAQPVAPVQVLHEPHAPHAHVVPHVRMRA